MWCPARPRDRHALPIVVWPLHCGPIGSRRERGRIRLSPQARLLVSILALLAVFLVGTAGYLVIESDRDLSFVDAAYMTVLTLSTVGFAEVWPLSPHARLWTIGTITFGIATVSYAFTSLFALIIGGEFREIRERHKMEKAIEHMSDHVIICGFGRIGALVAEELSRRGSTTLVIEQQRNLEVELREAGVPYVLGDSTEEATLLHAGLMRARALVIALPSDADTVYITLTAHTLRPELMIVARAEHPSAEAKLIRAGATRVVSPHVIGATRVANILTRPNVVDFVDMAAKGVDLEIDEYEVAPNSSLVGRTLADAHVRRKSGAMVVAIKRADGSALVRQVIGDRRGEGITLGNLGDELPMVGRVDEAISYAEKALEIFEAIDDPHAAKARAQLEKLRGQGEG